MKSFKIAVAQIPSDKGNVESNIKLHIQAINLAGKNAISLIVFPELSLTGYEPELAESLAFSVDDERLIKLSSVAKDNGTFVVLGAPLKSENKVEIGSIIISPEGETSTYSKMHLHPGEGDFFNAGSQLKTIEIENHKIAIAICADMNNPSHAQAYSENGATVYIGSVLITEGGYAEDTQKMANYAQQHNMLVAMANHNQPTGGWSPTGKSAIWNDKGLLAVASKTENALVVAQHIDKVWVSDVINIEQA